MNNGVNETTNQTIPGVKVAPPSDKPVDATTNDIGAVVSKAQSVVNTQTTSAASTVVVQPTVQPVVQPAPVTSNQAVANTSTPTAPVATTTSQTAPVTAQAPVMTATLPVDSSQATSDGGSAANADNKGKKKKEKKPKNKAARFLTFIVILLIGGIAFLWYYHQQQMMLMDIKCTPVSTTDGSKELDLNSTIVKDLYGKVKTTIREDLGGIELNDQMKVYLAYRQIATSDLYESNCNKFDSQGMEPFKCEISASFVPKAFKEESLQVELKKLFGEDTNIQNQNVQLGKTCIGGYQYIESRGEYVQGQCLSEGATLYRVEKELISATSNKSTIVLTEKVKYYGNEGLELPVKLVSGTYKYTFKLDMNYNYIYVDKQLVE